MIKIEPIKAFSDNYIWLVTTNEGLLVVDPGDAAPVEAYLDNNNKNQFIKYFNYPPSF